MKIPQSIRYTHPLKVVSAGLNPKSELRVSCECFLPMINAPMIQIPKSIKANIAILIILVVFHFSGDGTSGYKLKKLPPHLAEKALTQKSHSLNDLEVSRTVSKKICGTRPLRYKENHGINFTQVYPLCLCGIGGIIPFEIISEIIRCVPKGIPLPVILDKIIIEYFSLQLTSILK